MSGRSIASRRVLGIAGALGAAAIFAVSGTTLAAKALPSANGHGTTTNTDGTKRQFSFSARLVNADGVATGQANLINPAFTGANGKSPYRLHIDVKCMQVVGNTAVIGGTTKSTNDPNLVDAVYFTVQDNGEPGKGKDQISSVYFWDDNPATTGDPMACLLTGLNDFPLSPIDSGNVQVKSS